MADDRPFMPVEELVREVSYGGGEDYADGDNPGWFSARWNAESQELVLRYEPDEESEPQYRRTEHVFRYGAQARVAGDGA